MSHELFSYGCAHLSAGSDRAHLPCIPLGAFLAPDLTAREEKKQSRRQVPEPCFPARKMGGSLRHSGKSSSSKQRRNFGPDLEWPKITAVMREREVHTHLSVFPLAMPLGFEDFFWRKAEEGNSLATFPLLWSELSFCLGVDHGHNQWEWKRDLGCLKCLSRAQESSPRRGIQVPPVKARRTAEWTIHRERGWGGGGGHREERMAMTRERRHCDSWLVLSTTSEGTLVYNVMPGLTRRPQIIKGSQDTVCAPATGARAEKPTGTQCSVRPLMLAFL